MLFVLCFYLCYNKHMDKKCLFCEVEFFTNNKNKKYCSQKCSIKKYKKTSIKYLEYSRTYSREYVKKYNLTKRYSPKCRNCNLLIPDLKRKLGNRFCSDECRKERAKIRAAKYSKQRRIKILEMLGGAKCVYCGCDEFDVLEINHINGGGGKEIKNNPQWITDIYYGRRTIEDLEVTCIVCNAWYYAKNKIKKNNWKINWDDFTCTSTFGYGDR